MKFFKLIISYGIVIGYCLLVIGVLPLSAQTQTQTDKEEEALYVAKRAFEDGFYEVSIGLLERFLKNYPESIKIAEVKLLIGQCYFHQHKFLDALTKFEELLNDPVTKNIQDAILYWIAEVHFKGNNFNKAGTYYKKIIDEFPKSSYALASLYSLGWCLFQERKFSEALEYFKSVEEKSTVTLYTQAGFTKEALLEDASFKIIECLYNLKDYRSLKDRIKFYLKTHFKDTAKFPYLYFYLAEADYYLDNFTESIDEYSKVIMNTADDKMQALSKLGMGWAYLKLKLYPRAQETFASINSASLEKTSQEILLLGKAILYFETHKYTEANNAYQALISITADSLVLIQGYLGKADALYNLAEYKEAIAVFKEAQAKLTEFPTEQLPRELIDKLHSGLAWSYLKEGEFRLAIEEFQKIAKHTEDKIVKISALCQIGDAYQDSADYKKSIEVYDSILKDYPDSLYSDYVQYQLGLTLLKSSNYDGAIVSFQTIKKNFPDSKLLDDVSYALGLAYFQREDYSSSKEIFQKFPEEFKDSNLRPQAMYLLGTSLYNLGKFNEAIEVFKEIIRAYRQDTELVQKAEYEIADCFYRMGRENEAMMRFKALRSKYPDSRLTAEIMWWLGEYYYRHNDLNLARRYFTSLIQDFPKSNLVADTYYALGSVYAEESKHQEAIDNFNQVLKLGKSDLAGTATIAIADIYAVGNQTDLALKTYLEATQNYPHLQGLIHPKLADLYRKIGNFNQALDFYRRSLDLVPTREMSEIQFKIAETKEVQGKSQEAIEEYLKVTYLYTENNALVIKSLLRVAGIFEDNDNFKEALNIYRRIISMGVEEAKYASERIDWIKKRIK